jgi:5-methylcytosine-specific restriction protein A
MSAEFTAETRQTIEARSSSVCEICGAARAWDTHHRRPRGMGSTRRADSCSAAAGLHLCRPCHNLAESHRNLASLLGWLVPQTKDPAAQPVLRRGEWVRLLPDGTVEAA